MDIQLSYVEKGQGRPLILLHGNGESHAYFAKQIEFFSRDYRVIAPDTRGHGDSPRGSAPFTIAQFAEDLGAFMDSLSIKKAHILGFSDGGNIALSFALRHPGRVERLVLNGANLFPGGVKPHVQLPILMGYGFSALFAGLSPRAKAHMEMLRLMVKEPRINPGSLSTLAIPTLVIAGERDMIREKHTRLIAQSLPNAKLCLLPGDHFIAGKEPEAFNLAVEAFLRV